MTVEAVDRALDDVRTCCCCCYDVLLPFAAGHLLLLSVLLLLRGPAACVRQSVPGRGV